MKKTILLKKKRIKKKIILIYESTNFAGFNHNIMVVVTFVVTHVSHYFFKKSTFIYFFFTYLFIYLFFTKMYFLSLHFRSILIFVHTFIFTTFSSYSEKRIPF